MLPTAFMWGVYAGKARTRTSRTPGTARTRRTRKPQCRGVLEVLAVLGVLSVLDRRRRLPPPGGAKEAGPVGERLAPAFVARPLVAQRQEPPIEGLGFGI